MALVCLSRTSWQRYVSTTIFLVSSVPVIPVSSHKCHRIFLPRALTCRPSAISTGPQLLAGSVSPTLLSVGSCGASRLLCLHVQPLNPGPPCLPAGEEGELTTADQAAFRERLSLPVPAQGCSLTVRPGPSTASTPAVPLPALPKPAVAPGPLVRQKAGGRKRAGSAASQAHDCSAHLPPDTPEIEAKLLSSRPLGPCSLTK